MTFDINPYVAAGPIKFGMKRVEIHDTLNQKCIMFRRGGSRHETDHFDVLGLFIEYNEVFECIAIEMVKPASASYKGTDILNLNFKQAIKLLEDDVDVKKDKSGFTSYLHGIGVGFKKKISPAESVIAFNKGYYDASSERRRKLDSVDFAKMSSKEIDKFIKEFMNNI